MNSPFRSLSNGNYRLWAAGSFVSNIGTWFQRIAQDWLVLTQLTHHNATAVGIVMALQTGPMLVLLPLTGYAADHMDRRRLLIATQAACAILALILGLLTVSGLVALWHVYVLSLAFGCVAAFDAPVRQVFVSELVADDDLANAVALNATSFNSARLIGPALGGMVIAAVGSGWAIMINAASFAAVLISLIWLRRDALRTHVKPSGSRGALVAGFSYIWEHAELRVVLFMIFLVGTFGLNFALFVSTMTVSVFHGGAAGYGLMMSVMAVGSIAGSLISARQSSPRLTGLLVSVTIFAAGLAAAAVVPEFWHFGIALVVVGAASVSFTTATSSFMQLSTDPSMRGRVMSIRLAVGMGATPLGAPILGWVSDTFGSRWAVAIGAAACFAAAAIAGIHVLRRSTEIAQTR